MSENQFKKLIKKWGPSEVSLILGCSLDTAKKWSACTQTPPEWVQRLIIKELEYSKKE
jgi:hypothetical protein